MKSSEGGHMMSWPELPAPILQVVHLPFWDWAVSLIESAVSTARPSEDCSQKRHVKPEDGAEVLITAGRERMRLLEAMIGWRSYEASVRWHSVPNRPAIITVRVAPPTSQSLGPRPVFGVGRSRKRFRARRSSCEVGRALWSSAATCVRCRSSRLSFQAEERALSPGRRAGFRTNQRRKPWK